LLTGGARTALPRQQTLRAMIDWSYDLLSENERLLLCRLAVFMGGWTLEFAEQVCSDEQIDQYEILDMLGRLVDKSLVAVDASSSGTRYRILETVRQYAREKLLESGEDEKVRDQHLRAFIELVEKAEPEIRGPDQLVWLDRLDDEIDNLRAAMEFAFITRKVEAGLHLASNMGSRVWRYDGAREGLAWLTRFLDLSESKSYPVARAKALCVQSGLLWDSQRFGEARQRAEESLALFRTRGDQQGEIEALLSLAGPMQYLEGMDRTVELEQEALRLARSIGDVWREAKALGALGWDDSDLEKRRENWGEAIRLFRQVGDLQHLEFHLGALGESLALRGDVEAAEKLLAEAHEINQRTHNRRASEFALNAYGYLALIDRDYARARDCFAENAQNMDELGNRIGYLWARGRLGFALLLQGRVAEAREIILQTLQDFHREGNGSGVLFLIPKVAGLRVVENEHESAARLIGWADARQMISRPAGDQVAVDQDIKAIRAKIGEAAYEEAHRQGSTMTRDEAVALALREN
jgi:non-specific serine/threonine protein kinase